MVKKSKNESGENTKQPEINIGIVGHVDHGKCIAIDENILINNKLIKGKDLANRAKEKGTLIYSGLGEEAYSLDDLYTYSLDSNLKFKRVKANVFLQKYDGSLKYIKTKTGRTIKLTYSHPLLKNQNGNLIWSSSSKLKKGDYIAVARKLNLEYKNKDLFNPNYLNDLSKNYSILNYNDFIKLKNKTNNFQNFDVCDYSDLNLIRIFLFKTKSEFEKLCGLKQCQFINFNKFNDAFKSTIKNKIITKLKTLNISFNEDYIIFDRKANRGRLLAKFKDIKIDENFVKFLSMLTSEGSTSDPSKIMLSQSVYCQLRDEILNYLTSIGLKWKTYPGKDYEKDFVIENKAFVDYLVAKFDIKTGTSKNGSGIPSWVLGLNLEMKKLFLSYYFTFEAEVNPRSGQINLVQVNQNNIDIISYMLNELGIYTTLTKIKKYATNTKNRTIGIYTNLSISGRYNLSKFIEEIGILDLNKKEKILNYIDNLKNRSYDKRIDLPINLKHFDNLINLIRNHKSLKKLQWYTNIKEIRKKEKITYSALDYLLNEIKDLNETNNESFIYFDILAKAPIYFDQITEISDVPYNDYLIDLNVPDYHNFFAGFGGGILCHNTTLLKSLSGKWADTHSEEVKRGITIRLGYADVIIYECEEHGFTKLNKCCDKAKFKRVVSFVDAPGHETLMATMLSGAAIMDGALLLVSVNEECPQPQTKEHLVALEIIGIKNIIIIQNKIDLVTKEEALQNYNKIKEFVKGTIAEKAPIIPVSAIHNVNINYIIQAIEEFIPTPIHDVEKIPLLLIARSFDVNKPGTKISNLIGGILGGSLKQGQIKVGDKIEISPGRSLTEGGIEKWVPIVTEVVALRTGGENVESIVPGGSIAVQTSLDPAIVKSDQLAGNLAGIPGKLPKIWYELKLEPKLLKRVVGTKEDLDVKPIKKGEPLMLNVNSSTTAGIVINLEKNSFRIKLKRPVCAEENSKISISRRIGTRWRLVGWANLKV